MKFTVTFTDRYNLGGERYNKRQEDYEKEINSIEELLSFMGEVGYELIIRDDRVIEIYNGWRE